MQLYFKFLEAISCVTNKMSKQDQFDSQMDNLYWFCYSTTKENYLVTKHESASSCFVIKLFFWETDIFDISPNDSFVNQTDLVLES